MVWDFSSESCCLFQRAGGFCCQGERRHLRACVFCLLRSLWWWSIKACGPLKPDWLGWNPSSPLTSWVTLDNLLHCFCDSVTKWVRKREDRRIIPKQIHLLGNYRREKQRWASEEGDHWLSNHQHQTFHTCKLNNTSARFVFRFPHIHHHQCYVCFTEVKMEAVRYTLPKAI